MDIAVRRVVRRLIVTDYNEVEQVTARGRKGQAAMTAVAATLRTVADTYDAEDRANAHRLRNMY